MKNKTYKTWCIHFFSWIKTMWRLECMVGRSREQKKEVLLPLAGPHINRLACRHMGQQGRASRKPTEPQLPSGRRRGGKRQGEKRYSSPSSQISVVWHKETKRRSSKSWLGSPKEPSNNGEFSVKESLPASSGEALPLLLPTFVGQGQWEHPRSKPDKKRFECTISTDSRKHETQKSPQQDGLPLCPVLWDKDKRDLLSHIYFYSSQTEALS